MDPVPAELRARVDALIDAALTLERHHEADVAAVPEEQRASARNLLHYLAVRRHDVRDLQRGLSALGLSSLGRMESQVLATLCAVSTALSALEGRGSSGAANVPLPVGPGQGRRVLADHADAALGDAGAHGIRVMVTAPSDAASDPGLIDEMVRAGMTVMRINSAHDGADDWREMVANLRAAEAGAGRRCRVAFDLGGPKLRTGPLAAPVGVVKFQPERDELGRVVVPALVAFCEPDASSPVDRATEVPVEPGLAAVARPGDQIRLRDARGRKRKLKVVLVAPDAVVASSERTGYVTDDTEIRLRRDGDTIARVRPRALPLEEHKLRVLGGQQLVLTRGRGEGADAVHDEHGRLTEPPRIDCTLDAAFDAVRRGQRILFDDGEIEGTVVEVLPDEIRVDVLAPASKKLGADKGINIPDATLDISALTDEDRASIAAMVDEIDLVSLSFAQRRADVLALHDELDRLGADGVGVVLKIETRSGFENLPSLLLASLRRAPCAVMVARGDLAVELGFERLAEVQEEILWLCEAAHVPVIWATQVLESLAKDGTPSRAEVTDAAWSARAECVMLNKGPHITRTIVFLRDVLERMRTHRDKGTSLMRRLDVSEMGDARPAGAGPIVGPDAEHLNRPEA
ncbi:MAG: pyruvate kinase [Actinomycetota bacterium]|nr:pyruvate kinase [Actinomycetota bacterium]